MWGSAGFIVGVVLGSLVKALADRSLGMKSFWGRSYCPSCKAGLRWYDLFPIFSYIFLNGKCRYCKKKIPLEYPITEIILGILIAYLFTQTQFSLISIPDLILKIFFIVILVVLFITDFKKMFIPDRIVIPAIIISLISLVAITVYKIGYLYFYLSQSPIGRKLLPPYSDYFQRHALAAAEPLYLGILMGLLIGGFFLSLIIITRGKGMGGGDVKLGAFIGLMLGFPQALFAVVLSFLTGAIFSIILIIAGKKHFGQTIPFGPFLVLGSLIMLFWGNQIMDWYLKLGV
ncbi:prepilin peptidase [Candidatus Daviesbacteria bacterium]|nr:prepilin peptidase [Candidatus Daviesbacteria bacterium]